MWDWHWWCCFLPPPLQKPPNQSTLLTSHQRNDAVFPNCISFAAIARMFASWLNRRRMRYLILILCSPFLIPLFFVTFPFICAVEFFLYLSRRRRRKASDGGGGGSDGGDGVGLLQRYLEDQLMLVLGSVYECGDEDEDEDEEEDYGVDVEYIESVRPLLL
ncbi:hypothetical protein ACS0TY_027990 [Phlomoides rotata]